MRDIMGYLEKDPNSRHGELKVNEKGTSTGKWGGKQVNGQALQYSWLDLIKLYC